MCVPLDYLTCEKNGAIEMQHLTIIELAMCVCKSTPIERLMSPSPKSQVTFASVFS